MANFARYKYDENNSFLLEKTSQSPDGEERCDIYIGPYGGGRLPSPEDIKEIEAAINKMQGSQVPKLEAVINSQFDIEGAKNSETAYSLVSQFKQEHILPKDIHPGKYIEYTATRGVLVHLTGEAARLFRERQEQLAVLSPTPPSIALASEPSHSEFEESRRRIRSDRTRMQEIENTFLSAFQAGKLKFASDKEFGNCVCITVDARMGPDVIALMQDRGIFSTEGYEPIEPGRDIRNRTTFSGLGRNVTDIIIPETAFSGLITALTLERSRTPANDLQPESRQTPLSDKVRRCDLHLTARLNT